MKKLTLCLAAAAAVAFVSSSALSSSAHAGPVYLWGTTSKGKLAKAGKYSKTTRVYRASEHKKLKASAKKRYNQKADYCGAEFMVSSTQKRWMAAHTKAKHTIRVRERIAKGKYKTLCTVGATPAKKAS